MIEGFGFGVRGRRDGNKEVGIMGRSVVRGTGSISGSISDSGSDSWAPPLPLRAWRALRSRGWVYARHKALRRLLEPWPEWKRRWVYGDARAYWTLRGGPDYFREQEGQENRTIRARWLASRIAAYEPRSVLEVGCGYGKQLLELRRALGPGVRLAGVDFSPTQLAAAREYLGASGAGEVALARGDGARLPFGDDSFDLVLTSAVILHNPPAVAERIRREVARVARRWAAHNEDTDESYNRYGYDTGAWYRSAGLPLAECGPIPLPDARESASSQFCVAGPLG